MEKLENALRFNIQKFTSGDQAPLISGTMPLILNHSATSSWGGLRSFQKCCRGMKQC